MSAESSCIIRHFSHYCELSDDEKSLLKRLEESPSDTRANSLLWQTGDAASEFCTLSKGWAYSFRHLENGDRQILEVFLPGDIIGLREFAFSQRLEDVRMLTDGVVCYFPHAHLLDLFQRSVKLTSVVMAISSRHQALITERLINVARRTARQKVAHFLNEMYVRIGQIEPHQHGKLHLPLSQEQLADILGLSPVHVSRTFSALSEEGIVYRERRHVSIPDLKLLAREGEFDESYLREDMHSLLEGLE